jgi:hypothetical protein
MIFRREFLALIEAGTLTRAYRRWRKPGLKVGGTLKTAAGLLRFTALTPVDGAGLGLRQAKAAGYASLEALRRDLDAYPGGQVYEIRFVRVGNDPRLALRARAAQGAAEKAELARRLQRLDRASKRGPWTLKALRLLRERPGAPSRELAPLAGFEDALKFKLAVRKLKELGLTISLGTGYKLSPRGRACLAALEA